jgi:hypothetical protein
MNGILVPGPQKAVPHIVLPSFQPRNLPWAYPVLPPALPRPGHHGPGIPGFRISSFLLSGRRIPPSGQFIGETSGAKMKKDLTHIIIVLDRSGSMSSVQQATISGFNEFINRQRQLPGEATLLAIKFDDQYELLYEGALAGIAPLDDHSFVPRGMTALHDAIGRTIHQAGQKLAAMPEAERPEKVLFMILTDGLENASKEYTREKIAEMIQHQREKYSWEFIFLGANQDAVMVGSGFNIPQHAAMTYAAAPGAVMATMAAASAYTAQYRAGKAAAFTDEQREAALKGEV